MRPALWTPRKTLLYEQFDGTTLDTLRWTKTDTENKITVSDGLVFSGGKATPGSFDPMVVHPTPWVRRHGLTVIMKAKSAATNTYGPRLWLFNTATPSNPNTHGEANVYPSNTGAILVYRLGTAVTTPAPYAADTWKWLMVQMLQTGAAYWVSDDEIAWYPIWIDAAGTTSPLYVGVDNYNAIGNVGDLWLGYRSVPTPAFEMASPSITPTLGAELVTNGDMELDANWGNYLTPVTNERSNEQAHGGTYSRKLVSDSSDGIRSDAYVTTTGVWYQFVHWVYPSALTNSGWMVRRGNDSGWLFDVGISGLTANAWTQVVRVARETNGGGSARLYLYDRTPTIGTRYFDDASVKAITLASTLSLIGDPGRRDGLYDCAPTLTADTQEGEALWVDDETNPTYGLFAYHNGTNAILDKCENGTWTNLISAAATYSAGATLRVVSVPNGSNYNVALYYNGSQVGTTQTITPTSYGTKFCRFSTYASNGGGTLSCRVGTP